MGDERSAVFGRFFVAIINQAIRERAVLRDPLPCIVYIDEVHEYVNQHIATILEQARKYRVGLCVAHQDLGQLPNRVLDSLSANTSIKFFGGIGQPDFRQCAAMLGCNAEDFRRIPTGTFMAAIKNYLPTTSLRIPLGLLDQREYMTEEQYSYVLAAMRAQYAEPHDVPDPAPHTAHDQSPPSEVFRNANDIKPDPDY